MCCYCGVDARHPCTSNAEAARCPNCRDQGAYMDFKASDVAKWIRSNAAYSGSESELLQAAALIEALL